MDDVREVTYTTLAVFVIGVLSWIGFLYVSACGFTTTCRRGSMIAASNLTPVPTLIPATLPADIPAAHDAGPESCEVSLLALVGAWVDAGFPETAPFDFVDMDGTVCEATFEDEVAGSMSQANVWGPGALACTACHGPDLESSAGQLDLSSYEGIIAGSGRTPTEPGGKDILAGGDWESSILYLTLAAGHPPGTSGPAPFVFAGTPVSGAGDGVTATPTP